MAASNKVQCKKHLVKALSQEMERKDRSIFYGCGQRCFEQ